ncbi:MAG: sigma-54 dependent transcriptional regulator [Myxococcota bacterium]|nr:sigma-54 dependent transcriptional regulator [Myxococcota bacterium]
MEQQAKILVVDDDRAVLRAVSETLRRAGYQVVSVSDPLEGVTAAEDPSVEVAVVDIRMPNLSGLDLLKSFKRSREDLEVVVMTGHATVETALEAVRNGAFDYLTKPFEHIDQLTLTVARALERRRLRRRVVEVENVLAPTGSVDGMVGNSPVMRGVFKMVEAVAPTDTTVLIRGESGSGKELVARALHQRSPRRAKPFVAVNCSALSETLLDSELFGHVKGAFTGALAQKRGLFEAAHGGTLFLDEIGDVPLATQVRLLRALQEGEIKRVGANESIPVDVRVIAATHVNLEEARKQGRFRDDLYFRLSVIPLTLPSLRERPEDVPLLARHFLTRFSTRMGKQLSGFSPDALASLSRYSWPGNVRELENVVERAVVLSPGPVVELENLPVEIQSAKKPASVDMTFLRLTEMGFAQAKALSVAAFERRYLSTLLERTGGNISQAALAAGMDRSNFKRLLREHELVAAGDTSP